MMPNKRKTEHSLVKDTGTSFTVMVLGVTDLAPAWASLCSGLQQANYTCVPLSPSSVTW